MDGGVKSLQRSRRAQPEGWRELEVEVAVEG